jgi:hypothetical protein
MALVTAAPGRRIAWTRGPGGALSAGVYIRKGAIASHFDVKPSSRETAQKQRQLTDSSVSIPSLFSSNGCLAARLQPGPRPFRRPGLPGRRFQQGTKPAVPPRSRTREAPDEEVS